MVPHLFGKISFLDPIDNRSQPPVATEAVALEDAAESDEPPDRDGRPTSTGLIANTRSQFAKSTYSAQKQASLLTRILHSEDDSHVDEEDYAFYDSARAQSSASTYSRSSAVSMADLTSEGRISPRTTSPSPKMPPGSFKGLPFFKQNMFASKPAQGLSTPARGPKESTLGATEERSLEQGLGRKRCITFACGSKSKAAKDQTSESADHVETRMEATAARKCTLKFVCPTRTEAPATTLARSRTGMSSPPPAGRRAPPSQPKIHRGSDATVRNNSPKLSRRPPGNSKARRGSVASDISITEATRFHEFASAEQEVDDWTKESGCFRRRLTIDDTLAIEHDLRKLGREVEEEEEEEAEEQEFADEGDDDEDGEEYEDDDEEAEIADSSTDDGFKTDDEDGFARSDDDSDGDSDYDWWTPGRASGDRAERIRPPKPRRASESSIESNDGTEALTRAHRQSSQPIQIEQVLELPDSTDFVCGTLDEDKPLEQAYITHIEKRRAAKHISVPQDIDPTFPESDPDIDDEEDEDSDHAATESDHPMVFPNPSDLHPGTGRARSRRSPLPSPRRTRSPAPTVRPAYRHTGRRLRSPAPYPIGDTRMSSSVPRRGIQIVDHNRFQDQDVDEDDNTPRFNRGAIDIVVGLEKKRQRRHEKWVEKTYARKAKHSKGKEKKHIQPGKGAEKMRCVGVGLNEYRGRKSSTQATTKQLQEVHMLSY